VAVAPGGTAALSVTAIYADASQSTLLQYRDDLHKQDAV
jgi:hypothetical protein